MDRNAAERQATHRLPYSGNQDLYKVGVHNMVFRFNGEEWMRSSVYEADLVRIQKSVPYVAPALIY